MPGAGLAVAAPRFTVTETPASDAKFDLGLQRTFAAARRAGVDLSRRKVAGVARARLSAGDARTLAELFEDPTAVVHSIFTESDHVLFTFRASLAGILRAAARPEITSIASARDLRPTDDCADAIAFEGR